MDRIVGTLLLAVSAVLSPVCFANELLPIFGKTADGYMVEIDLAHTCDVKVWEKNRDGTTVAKNFMGEPCVHRVTVDKKRGLVRLSLSFAKNSKSPLAGTKYVGRAVSGDCEKGDPMRYVCVAGCDANRRAPRKLTQDYWEC